MSTSLRRIVSYYVLALLLTASEAAAQGAAGVKPQQLFPADTVAYFSYDGMQRHEAAWKQTAAYEALVDSGLWEALESWLMARGGESPLAPALHKLVMHALSRGVSGGLLLPAGAETPTPLVTVVLHDGASLRGRAELLLKSALPDVETVDVSARRALQGRLSRGSDQVWRLWTEGEHLVFTIGAEATRRALAAAGGQSPDITQARLWRLEQEPAPENVAVYARFWIDVEQVLRSWGETRLPRDPAHPDFVMPTVKDYAALWGLDSVREIVVRQGFQGKACWSETKLVQAGPRQGLLALWNGPAFSLNDLPPLPERTSSFYAASLDWTSVYDAGWKVARRAAAMFQSPSQEELTQGWDQFEDRLGFNVRDDLLASLGPVHVVYADPSNAFGGLGVGAAIQVRDAARLRRVVDRLAELIPNGPGAPRLMRSRKQDHELLSLGQQGVPFWPTLCVADKWLVIGLTPQTVESFLLRGRGKLPTWKPDAETAAALQQLPQSLLSLTVTQPREFVLSASQMVPFLQAMLLAQQPGVAADPMEVEFPSSELIAQPLFANVGVCALEGDQILWRSRMALPGLPLVGGFDGPSVGTSAVAVAFLLPAVQQSREAARRTQSRNNLKQLGLALHNYADTFQTFPSGTVVASAAKPEDRLSWMVSILPYVDQAPVYQGVDQKRAWDRQDKLNLIQVRIPTYQNPSLAQPAGFKDLGYTDYVGVAGLGANGPNTRPREKGAGMFAYDHPRGIRDVLDGTSNTVMVGDASGDRGAWAQGGKASIRPFTAKPYLKGPDGFGGAHVGGAHFLLGDGSVRFISENIDPALMEALITIQGGERIGDF